MGSETHPWSEDDDGRTDRYCVLYELILAKTPFSLSKNILEMQCSFQSITSAVGLLFVTQIKILACLAQSNI